MNKLKTIPNFKSKKEEAEFWDTHETSDYFDFSKAERLYDRPRKKRETFITVRLDDELKEAIDNTARKHDISTSSLIRMWALEKLNV